MKTELFLKVKEDVFNYIKDHALGGRYEGLQKELIKHTNSNSPYVRKALETLEKENKIKTIQTYSQSRESYIWEVVDKSIVSTRQENLVSQKTENKSEKDNTDNNKNIDLNKYIIETFDNFNLKIYDTKKGLAIQVIDIVAVLKTSRQSVYQLLDYNKELFEPFIIKEKVGNNVLNNERLFLTKDGLIGFLMKISYNKLSDEKKKLVLDFQRWAIEKLSTLVSKGKVELTDMEQAKVQDNIKETLELDNTEMDKLFNDLELEINNKIGIMKNTVKKYKEENDYVIMENQNLKNINNSNKIKIINLYDKIRDLK